MCITLPYKIKSIKNNIAVVENDSVIKKVEIRLISGVKKGDWILVSQNIAVSKISAKEAEKTLELMQGLSE